MSTTNLQPGQRVTGWTPGRYSKEFTGTYQGTSGEGVQRFASVKRDDGTVIKARPKTLTAID